MEIVIRKGSSRHILTCKREDGSVTSENLGPSFPDHDIAHYVVETKFEMAEGFYGTLRSGMTIAELSDKEVIKGLGPESWLAEIMARNLQGLGSGAAAAEQYAELVSWESKTIEGIVVPDMGLSEVQDMKVTFDDLCSQWKAMSENDELILPFV